MFHSFFTKIIGIILGAIAFVTGPRIITYHAVSSTTPLSNIEIIATTTPTTSGNIKTDKATTTQITKKTTPLTGTITPIPIPVKSTPPPITQAELSMLFDRINSLTRTTLVNILCTTQTGTPFGGASGSGVIVTSDGVILTNAHIGQYALLKDFNGQKNSVECTIRTGSPAYPSYKVELVFISPQWVDENKKILTSQSPTGTGEHDYAFLKIVSHVDGSPITEKLPFMPINITENVSVGSNTLLASYPAGFLGSISIEKELYQTSAITQISKLFTFSSTSVDVISVPGTVISQKGSSGGAVVDSAGKLIGIITTSTEADTTGGRDLRAITMAYVNRDLIKNAGTNLQSLLENSQSASDIFNAQIGSTLTKILTDSILNR